MKCLSFFILTLLLCFSCNQIHEKPAKAIPKKSMDPVKESPKVKSKKLIPKKYMKPLKKSTEKQRERIPVDTLLPKITR